MIIDFEKLFNYKNGGAGYELALLDEAYDVLKKKDIIKTYNEATKLEKTISSKMYSKDEEHKLDCMKYVLNYIREESSCKNRNIYSYCYEIYYKEHNYIVKLYKEKTKRKPRTKKQDKIEIVKPKETIETKFADDVKKRVYDSVYFYLTDMMKKITGKEISVNQEFVNVKLNLCLMEILKEYGIELEQEQEIIQVNQDLSDDIVMDMINKQLDELEDLELEF